MIIMVVDDDQHLLTRIQIQCWNRVEKNRNEKNMQMKFGTIYGLGCSTRLYIIARLGILSLDDDHQWKLISKTTFDNYLRNLNPFSNIWH